MSPSPFPPSLLYGAIIKPSTLPTTLPTTERIQAATDLLSDAFKTDPTITYLLSSLTPNQRAAYRPIFFRAILTAAASNNASFDELKDWQSCGVILPPGSAADKLAPSLYPTLISVLWSIGLGGCQASPTRLSFLPVIPADSALTANAMGNGASDQSVQGESVTQGRGVLLCVFPGYEGGWAGARVVLGVG